MIPRVGGKTKRLDEKGKGSPHPVKQSFRHQRGEEGLKGLKENEITWSERLGWKVQVYWSFKGEDSRETLKEKRLRVYPRIFYHYRGRIISANCP